MDLPMESGGGTLTMLLESEVDSGQCTVYIGDAVNCKPAR